MFETDDTVKRMIDAGLKDQEINLGELDLSDKNFEPALSTEEFMKCTSFVIATTFDEKIESFFEYIDTDGNGLLSWDEIHEICLNSLKLFETGKNDDLLL